MENNKYFKYVLLYIDEKNKDFYYNILNLSKDFSESDYYKDSITVCNVDISINNKVENDDFAYIKLDNKLEFYKYAKDTFSNILNCSYHFESFEEENLEKEYYLVNLNAYREVWKILKKGEFIAYIVCDCYSNDITNSFDNVDSCYLIMDKDRECDNKIFESIINKVKKFYKVRRKSNFNIVFQNSKKMELKKNKENLFTSVKNFDRVIIKKDYIKKLLN